MEKIEQIIAIGSHFFLRKMDNQMMKILATLRKRGRKILLLDILLLCYYFMLTILECQITWMFMEIKVWICNMYILVMFDTFGYKSKSYGKHFFIIISVMFMLLFIIIFFL